MIRDEMFEEAVAGIILLRDALDDAISVLEHVMGPYSPIEVKDLLERLKHTRTEFGLPKDKDGT
jgi:hypothetical protein